MFERFTDPARRAVVLSAEEARGLGHDYIGTEHILLGIMGSEGAGFRLLQSFEVPFDEVEARIVEIVGRGQGAPPEHIPFTPRAKKVLEMSLRQALQMGENYIGGEHLLLALLREGQGIGAQVLVERGVTLEAVRGRLDEIERERPSGDDASTVAELGERSASGEETIEIPAEQFARLVEEVARLRDLLRHHGIDPGEESPGFGEEWTARR